MDTQPMQQPMQQAIPTPLPTELAIIAQRLQQSTVQIQVRRSGIGSGVIWNRNGLIITNAHVVRGNSAIVQLADGRQLDGRVVLRDRPRDLAALVVNAENLTAAVIGNASRVRVGEVVLAVGNPLGLTGAVSVGIVHALPASGIADRPQWVQADVRLAPGNSGGPLATVDGAVIGINSMIMEGRAIAIPSHTVERFLSSQHDRPYLGVTLQPIVASQRDALGWLVLEVTADSPAEVAGIGLGDRLVGINGHAFRHLSDLATWLGQAVAGESIQLNLLRGNEPQAVALVLGHSSRAEAA